LENDWVFLKLLKIEERAVETQNARIPKKRPAQDIKMYKKKKKYK